MKRLTLLLTAALLVVAADTADAQKLHIGGRGGATIGTADTQGSLFAEDVGTRTAYHFGILGQVDISSWFALQTEIWYTNKGFSEGNGDVALDINYFEIPVLAVVKLSTTLSPHLYAGPVLSIESKCKVTFEGETETCEEAREGAPRTKGADSGLMFGGGIAFQFGPGSLLLDAMYYHGLTDISENSDEIDSIKTRTFYLSAGYMFPIGS